MNFEEQFLTLIVEKRGFSERKGLPSDRVTIDADPTQPDGFAPEKKWVGASKHLMTNKILGSIKTLDKDMVNFLSSRSFSGIGDHSFILPRVLMSAVDVELNNWQTKRDALVAELADGSWQASIAEAQSKLGFLFNPNDYISAELLPQAFAVKWRFEGVSETLRNLMRVAAAKAVEETVKRVEPGESGRERRFTEKTFESLKDFLASYDARQVGNDEELDALRDDIRKVVALGESYLNMREGGKVSDMVLEIARRSTVNALAPVAEKACAIAGTRQIELED